MKSHSFTSHPFDELCWRCERPANHKWHKYKSVFYTPGRKGVRCLNTDCAKPLRRSVTPAKDFVVGPYSLEWREDWCRYCHTPFRYRRKADGRIEFRLMNDGVTGFRDRHFRNDGLIVVHDSFGRADSQLSFPAISYSACSIPVYFFRQP